MTSSVLYRLMGGGDAKRGQSRGVPQELERDLECLLNTRRPFANWVTRVEGSVAAFGMPDVTAEDMGSPDARQRIADHITRCLRLHEPRLQVDDVIPLASPDAGGRFLIYARLRGSDESLEFGARLTPIHRLIEIEGNR